MLFLRCAWLALFDGFETGRGDGASQGVAERGSSASKGDGEFETGRGGGALQGVAEGRSGASNGAEEFETGIVEEAVHPKERMRSPAARLSHEWLAYYSEDNVGCDLRRGSYSRRLCGFGTTINSDMRQS